MAEKAKTEKLIEELGATIESKKVTKFLMVNIPLTVVDKEYRWQFPKHFKRFTLQVRDGTPIRISTEQGKVATSQTPYFTLHVDNSIDEGDLEITDKDEALYFACSLAGKVIEILVGV